MKILTTFAAAVLLLCFSHLVSAQFPVVFKVNQPDLLQANAGPSVNVLPGTLITLGNTPSATGGTPPYSYLWQPGYNLSDSTSPNPSLTADSALTYTLFVSDAKNCMVSSSIHISLITAIHTEHSKPLHFEVFPNPSCNGHFFLSVSQKLQKPVTIRLYDVTGKTLLTSQLEMSSGESVPLSVPANFKGLLFVEISAGHTYHLKLIAL